MGRLGLTGGGRTAGQVAVAGLGNCSTCWPSLFWATSSWRQAHARRRRGRGGLRALLSCFVTLKGGQAQDSAALSPRRAPRVAIAYLQAGACPLLGAVLQPGPVRGAPASA